MRAEYVFGCNRVGHCCSTNDIPQVAILGSAFRFDFPATQKLSVKWFIVGCGEYELRPGDGSSEDLPPVNRPVDVYLDEWVQIQFFLYQGVTQRLNTSVSNPAFSYDPTNYPLLKVDGGTM